MPVARSDRPAKPILDAVNDAVSALTDVVRALRASAAQGQRERRARALARPPARRRIARAKSEIKASARVATSSMKRSARAIRHNVREAKHGIKERLEHAWNLLTREPTTDGHPHGLTSRKSM